MRKPATSGDCCRGDGRDAGTFGASKKKQRMGSSCCLSDLAATATGSASRFLLSSCDGGFNDSATADVVLRLCFDLQSASIVSPIASSDSSFIAAAMDQSEILVYLHSNVLRRSKYFAALLSERWQQMKESDSNKEDSRIDCKFSLPIPTSADSIDHYLTVLRLLYSHDLLPSIVSVTFALDILPIALELLFEDCIKACVQFLEAVPWNEDEEEKILNLVPFLSTDESKDLLARISPAKNDSSEEMMLHGLILNAIHNHPNMALAKAFVAKLLRDFSSRESAIKVLDKEFEKSLKVVKQSMEEYLSPDFRGHHNETEAIQRLNLHTAMTNGKHLLWLVERMIEVKSADTAVKAWSEQASFTSDLQRALRDDAWKNMAPNLPAVLLRCTSKLANAVVSGNILAARQVRMKLVRDWLPVLIISKDNISPMGANHKSLYLELEETFLRIISTLPMSDAQNLLQQCLSFSTRNVDDCPHLVAAFSTWFRRANRPQQSDFNG